MKTTYDFSSMINMGIDTSIPIEYTEDNTMKKILSRKLEKGKIRRYEGGK